MKSVHAASKQFSRKKAFMAVTFSTIAVSAMVGAFSLPSITLAQNEGITAADDTFANLGDGEIRTFTVDVAQNGTTNAQNDVDPAEGLASFRRGDTFIIDGNIYSKGTLQPKIFDPDPNAPVIGKYRISGTFTSISADFNASIAGDPSSQVIAFATESFALPDDDATILTEGIWPNARKSAYRVVVGGTGRFRDVVGEAYEQNIGEGTGGLCNLRVRFRIRKASVQHDR